MPVEAGAGDVLREDDTDGNEDGAAAGSVRNGDFETRAFGIFIAAAESDTAFGQIFANGNFFLKTAAADAREDARFDPCAIAARDDALFERRARAENRLRRNFGLNFDPDGRRFAVFAEARDAFANLEGFELELVEINDFAALAETAFHQHAGEGFVRLGRRREFDVPEVRANVEHVNGVKEAFGFLIDFGDDTGADGFDLIAIELAFEGEFLALEELFVDANDAAIAADKKGLSHLPGNHTARTKPRGFHGHAKGDAVALAHGFGASGGHGHNQGRYLNVA